MKIVFLDGATVGNDVDLSILSTYGELKCHENSRPEEVADRIRDARIVITNKVVLTGETLATSPVELVCLSSTGTNSVDLDFARQNGIAVTNVPGYSTQGVVQHTFALLFYLIENLRYYDDYVRSGRYGASSMFCCLDRPITEIAGKTWGIIGLGQIGRGVAIAAKGFGANIVYASTTGRHDDPDFTRLELDELLAKSDIVSIHSPLNETTLHLIDRDAFKKMKSSAVMLNLARGGIVDEHALADALANRRIAGAGLDVLAEEPISPDSPLSPFLSDSRLVITPHIAWSSIESRNRLMFEIGENIRSFLEGGARNRIV